MEDCLPSQIYLALDFYQLDDLKSGKAEKLPREEKYLEDSLVRKCSYSRKLEHFLKPQKSPQLQVDMSEIM